MPLRRHHLVDRHERGGREARPHQRRHHPGHWPCQDTAPARPPKPPSVSGKSSSIGSLAARSGPSTIAGRPPFVVALIAQSPRPITLLSHLAPTREQIGRLASWTGFHVPVLLRPEQPIDRAALEQGPMRRHIHHRALYPKPGFDRTPPAMRDDATRPPSSAPCSTEPRLALTSASLSGSSADVASSRIISFGSAMTARLQSPGVDAAHPKGWPSPPRSRYRTPKAAAR